MGSESLDKLLELHTTTVTSTVTAMFNGIVDSIRKDVSHLQTENSELKKSLEFAYAEVSELKKICERLSCDLNALKNGTTDEELPERVRFLEDHARSNNIRISGITHMPNETSEQTIKIAQDLIKDKLKLNDVKVVSAFRSRGFAGEEKQVVASLLCSSDKLKCLKAKKSLRGTNVFINEDVSKKTFQIRKTKLPELKKLRDEGFIAYFSGTRIITRTRNGAAGRHPSPNRPAPETGSGINSGARGASGTASGTRTVGSAGQSADPKAAAGARLKPTTTLPATTKTSASKQPYGTRSKNK